MVKVQILQSAQGPGVSYGAGEFRIVSIVKAEHWEKSGFAKIVEYIEPKKGIETAVSAKVATAENTAKVSKDVVMKQTPKRARKRKAHKE